MRDPREALVSISQRDWSLHRKGPADETRHREKVKEAIKGNLPEIIGDGSIITQDPTTKRIIKVPLRGLELPHIRHGDNRRGVGSGEGRERPGDIIGTEPGKGSKGKGGAGNQPGVEYYETELTIEELQQLVFADLALPNLQPKKTQQIESDHFVMEDVRKNRSPNNLDYMRTALANLQRNAEEGKGAQLGGVTSEDFRQRSFRHEVKEDSSAVAIFMRDASGSMGEFEKYITRAFAWWTATFLRSKYPAVKPIFIIHDTEAREVEEDDFFHLGESGGTKCSSANELTLDIIKNRYPPNLYNIYPIHFSDGDNWGEVDNNRCVDLVREMLDMQINQYGYVEIQKTERSGGLMDAYRKRIDDPRFEGIYIKDKDGIWLGLQKMFDPAKDITWPKAVAA